MASLYDRLKSTRPLSATKKEDRSKNIKPLMIQQSSLVIPEKISQSFSGQTLSDLTKTVHLQDYLRSKILFLDTETTGLSGGAGTLAFLVGLGEFGGNQLRICQYLIQDYHQETEMLVLINRKIQQTDLLVTYNGTSFDIPLLNGRMTINRIVSGLINKPHVDLLHVARRLFKLRLGRCSLNRMEESVLGFARQNDLPGNMVPARFFEFIKTRRESLMTDVLVHNRIDIHSLARLFLVLVELHENPFQSAYEEDLFSLGKVFEARKKTEKAVACYRACSNHAVKNLAKLQMAELLRKEGFHQEAAETLEGLRGAGNIPVRMYISLAKIYEHRFRDPKRALEITKQGMLYCLERLGSQVENNRDYLDLVQRSLRLMRKAERIHP